MKCHLYFLLHTSWEDNKMAKKAPGTRVRDAKTGRFLPKGTDKRRPTTTVKETVKLCKRK